MKLSSSDQSAGAVEYTDSICKKKGKTPLPSDLELTLNNLMGLGLEFWWMWSTAS